MIMFEVWICIPQRPSFQRDDFMATEPSFQPRIPEVQPAPIVTTSTFFWTAMLFPLSDH